MGLLMDKRFLRLIFLSLLLAWILPSAAAHAQALNLPPLQDASSTPELDPPTPADVIEAVNTLRLSHGLNPLTVHPVLMQVAALQASALASSEGAVGHERPCGMTLGQQLLSMGYPLLGDLSLDGYRSENWVAAGTIEQIMSFWQGDELHLNTMLSPNRSDIGAAVAVGDQTYVVLETAWSTSSGQMQYDAHAILTGIPMTQTLCAGFASGEISDYSIPVAVSTARPDGDVVHEVKYGQNLWTIAELYHVHVEDIKRLNGLTDDSIVVGWKLLIAKGATQPPPVTDTPPAPLVTSTATPYPTAAPFHTVTPSLTPTVPTVPPNEFVKQNSTVIVGLLIAFSVLSAAVIGFSRKRER